MPSLKVAILSPPPVGNTIVMDNGDPLKLPVKVPPLMSVRVKLVMVARPDPVDVTVTKIVRLEPVQGLLHVTVMVGVEIVPGLLNRTALPLANATAPVDPMTVKVLVADPATTLPMEGALEISIATLSACAAEPNTTRAVVNMRRNFAGLKVMPVRYASQPQP
jgi:hypothetical protein